MDHKIKVLFLDIDNTLLDFDAGAAWAMNLCFKKAGLEYRPEMFAVFKEENNKIWRRIELGKLTMDDLFYVRWQTVLLVPRNLFMCDLSFFCYLRLPSYYCILFEPLPGASSSWGCPLFASSPCSTLLPPPFPL